MKHRSFFHFSRQENGFTIIEAALVLLVFGIIAAGIFLAFNSVNQGRKLSDTKRQITEIVNNAREYFSGRNINLGQTTTYPNPVDTNAFMGTMQSAQVFPSDVTCTPNNGTLNCSNVYNGTYILTLFSDNANGSTQKYQLDVAVSNIPQDACINLVSNLAANTGQGDFLGTVSGTNLTAPAALTLGNLTGNGNACAANSNTVTFRFRL